MFQEWLSFVRGVCVGGLCLLSGLARSSYMLDLVPVFLLGGWHYILPSAHVYAPHVLLGSVPPVGVYAPDVLDYTVAGMCILLLYECYNIADSFHYALLSALDNGASGRPFSLPDVLANTAFSLQYEQYNRLYSQLFDNFYTQNEVSSLFERKTQG